MRISLFLPLLAAKINTLLVSLVLHKSYCFCFSQRKNDSIYHMKSVSLVLWSFNNVNITLYLEIGYTREKEVPVVLIALESVWVVCANGLSYGICMLFQLFFLTFLWKQIIAVLILKAIIICNRNLQYYMPHQII